MKCRFSWIIIMVCLLGDFESVAQNQVKDFEPVTDRELLNPDPGDWINWRRTLDGWGYSPLNQIDRDNVGDLQLVWSWATPPGTDQVTPLVHDGMMYIPSLSGIQALDAATGDLVWEYLPRRTEALDADRPTTRQPGVARRNVAIYGDKIFAGTSDAHLVALDARTGELVWDHRVADNELGFRYTSGPIIVKGKVVAGVSGCERYKNELCFISAHNSETGAELWRTSTVARPGEPGGDTWGDLALAFRAGSDAWIPGSYDSETDLIYWSTAQAKPWASVQRGTEGAALYSNSTLALDPDTGSIRWYFQHIPAETHDLDEVFEVVILDRGDRRSIFKMGKIGVLWELDAETGTFMNAYDLGYQNIVDINPTSGQGILRRERIPEVGVPIDYCPGPGGLKNLWAMAYHPETDAFYIPIVPSCAHSVFEAMPEPREEGGGGVGRSDRRFVLHPDSPEHLGHFVAMDSQTGEVLWRRRSRMQYGTSALTTAGGLVFVGNIDRYFYAFDVRNGDELWRTRTPTSSDGFPITYAIGGRQYLAVPSGAGWFNHWNNARQVFPDSDLRLARAGQHRGASVIQVFALKEQ
jgi:alcohol dehydrogenase (cytochrome c)